ncbi:hypothetical protein AA11_06160 [Salmonella enterica subsp. diarizonae]|nr:hypothetical protein [Salmonella enterica subsp. diarizonae]
MAVIRGTLSNASGDPLAGVKIILTPVDETQKTVQAVTSMYGAYEMSVGEGDWRVTLDGRDNGIITVAYNARNGTLGHFMGQVSGCHKPAAPTIIKGDPGVPGQDGASAFEVWQRQQSEGSDISVSAYMAFQEGKKGDKGDPGPSAFDIWKSQQKDGADTSEAAYLAFQEGKKGDKGDPGPSAYDIWKSQQKDGADTSEAAYLTFQEGKKGDKGDPGPSAYDVWKSQQKDGADTSEAAYLAFQEGKKGDKGDPGPSAYDVWKFQQKDGADTSEAAYLTFQEGKKGDPGENGKDGENGRDGKDGISSVKTDGKTITGDGNTTPLALGPAEPYAVGTYISAKFESSYLFDGQAPSNGSLIDRGTFLSLGDVLNTIVDGSLLFPSDTTTYNTYVFHPPGQWISCSSIYATGNNVNIFAIWRRIR